jgi:hypothetical protein
MIQIRIRANKLQIQIQEDQKHTDPTDPNPDPDPGHWLKESSIYFIQYREKFYFYKYNVYSQK